MVKRNVFMSVATILIIVMMVGMCSAIAATTENTEITPRTVIELSRSYSGSFDEAWQLTASGAEYTQEEYLKHAFMTYGYNTFLINEDYCWAENSATMHWAELYNDNGWHYGPFKAAGNVSKIEVTHAGSVVSYFCTW